jgi:polysaccharide deacetylase 2 family uncharacterized protein YibQ
MAGALAAVFAVGAGCGWVGGAYVAEPPTPSRTVELSPVNPIAWADPGPSIPLLPDRPITADGIDAAALAPASNAVPIPAAKPGAARPTKGFHHPQAVPVRVPTDAPKVAIVLDDLGLNRARTMRAVKLPAPVTLSFLTYADGLAELTAAARAAGQEVLAHVPMQPHDVTWDAGDNVLDGELTARELTRRLDWALSRVDGKIGVNNHMGSAFTEDRPAMRTVLATLKARGLMFLDSRTTPNSVGQSVARELGVPYAARDVFLDNTRDPEAVRESLDRAVRIARESGSAVAIGHPYPVTFDVLAAWIPGARERGIAIVPLSAVTRPAQAPAPQTAAREPAE